MASITVYLWHSCPYAWAAESKGNAMLANLEKLAAQAAVEKEAAEEYGRQVEVAISLAKTDALNASQRRSQLADDLSQAIAAAEATTARLGDVRGSLSAAERELETLADTAAAGSEPAVRSLAKHSDDKASLAELVKAHERRARLAEERRAQAEAALAAHDAATAQRDAAGVEMAMRLAAEAADRNLAAAVTSAERLSEAIYARQVQGAQPAWACRAVLGVHTVLVDALHKHAQRLETTAGRTGPAYPTRHALVEAVNALTGAWSAHRQRTQAAADPMPPEAA